MKRIKWKESAENIHFYIELYFNLMFSLKLKFLHLNIYNSIFASIYLNYVHLPFKIFTINNMTRPFNLISFTISLNTSPWLSWKETQFGGILVVH